MEDLYAAFLSMVPNDLKEYVEDLNCLLIEKNCKRTIEPAAKGYLVRYTLFGKSLLNYVFRKGFVKARIYASNIAKYQSLLNQFPYKTKEEIATALDCKKLTGRTCSPTCPGGYTFMMDEVEYKKCKNMAFLITLNQDNNPIIRKMVVEEINGLLIKKDSIKNKVV